MEHTSRSHEAREGMHTGKTPNVCAGMRAVPGFDQETGRLAGVTLATRPPRSGASIGVHTERSDLDAAVPPLRGWHWFEDRGDIVCELAPTTQDVLVQVAEDILREDLADYQLHGYDPAERLRGVATHRMSLPADEAEFQCARLLREYQGHLRRVEADDEG